MTKRAMWSVLSLGLLFFASALQAQPVSEPSSSVDVQSVGTLWLDACAQAADGGDFLVGDARADGARLVSCQPCLDACLLQYNECVAGCGGSFACKSACRQAWAVCTATCPVNC